MGRHYDLARQMGNYWANFIKTGNPNGADADGTPMPEWRPYNGEEFCAMKFTADGPVALKAEETPFKAFLMEFMRDSISASK